MINLFFARTSPLCFMPDGRLVCYRHGDIIIIDGKQELLRFPLFRTFKERLLEKSKIVSRLLRLGIRTAIAIDDSIVLLSIDNMLYEMNINTGVLSKGYYCGDGIRPLLFSNVFNVQGISDGVYFGEYYLNEGKRPVNIYHRTGVDQWETVYTFHLGMINHVHNIIADPYRDCLWVFTGDFDDSAAIWKVTDDFHCVKRVVYNDQKYRGCVAFAIKEGLLYATDAPFAENYIFLMNTETFDPQSLYSLHGSCIYGCKWRDKYVFSSTVEGDGRNETLFKLLIDKKRGAGIKDNYVHLYLGDPSGGFREVYKEKKDHWPFLFQYGVFRFPAGNNDGDILYFQPIGTQRNDYNLIGFKK